MRSNTHTLSPSRSLLLRHRTHIDCKIVVACSGSGTIFELLRLKRPFIAVTNDALMNSHQSEIADAMAEEGYLVSAGLSNLQKAIAEGRWQRVKPFPQAADPNPFLAILQSHMNMV